MRGQRQLLSLTPLWISYFTFLNFLLKTKNSTPGSQKSQKRLTCGLFYPVAEGQSALLSVGLRRFNYINSSSSGCLYYHLHFLPFGVHPLHRQYPKSNWEDQSSILETTILASVPCTKSSLKIWALLWALLLSLWDTKKEPETPVKNSS